MSQFAFKTIQITFACIIAWIGVWLTQQFPDTNQYIIGGWVFMGTYALTAVIVKALDVRLALQTGAPLPFPPLGRIVQVSLITAAVAVAFFATILLPAFLVEWGYLPAGWY